MEKELVDFLETNGQQVPIHSREYLILSDHKLIVLFRWLADPDHRIRLSFGANWRVINLWEDVWQQSAGIVQSRLLSAIGRSHRLPGRATVVRQIDGVEANGFLQRHHLLSGTPSSKYRYGLFLPKQYYRLLTDNFLVAASNPPEMLVAVMTFNRPRKYIRDHEPYASYEMLRFATYRNISVVGGFTKLLKAFEKQVQPDDVVTYADAEWSSGASYEKMGFERMEQTPPLTFHVHQATYERYREVPHNAVADAFVEIKNSGNWKFIKKYK